MDDNLLDALTRSRLTSAGFEVVDDAEAPELVFNFKTLTDPAWPDLMGVVLLLDVEQKVEVLRLGEKMRLPTTTVVSRALANRETIRDVIAQRALNATSQFINLCKQLE